MIRQLRAAASACLLGLTALLVAPVASAAVVTGDWDPKLPSEFGNFGWTARINVSFDSTACTVGTQAAPVGNGVTIVNFLGIGFGCNRSLFSPFVPFKILSAEVGIYDYSTKVIEDVLRFDANSFGELLLGRLELGPDGSIQFLRAPRPSDIVRSTLKFGEDDKAYDFRLALPGANPELRYRREDNTDPFKRATEPFTITNFVVNNTADPAAVAQVLATTQLRTGQLIFSVPVPGSLVLTALALLAAGVAATRRQRPAA